MLQSSQGTERFRSYLVLAATIGTIAFNALAATGRIGGVTPKEISDHYPTLITPAGYAFSIWSLIYVGLICFSVYQMLPRNIERYRKIRSLYILSCAFNCAWIYFWHSNQIGICLAIIVALAVTLFLINYQLQVPDSPGENWLVRSPFGIYFGWVTAASLVNFAVYLNFVGVKMSDPANTLLAVSLILIAAGLGIYMRARYLNYLYPLAIAWALTAIAVEQSGHTLVVTASAIGVIASLIACISFVMNMKSSISE
ncbi:MAG: tryptophan-rich sensory protein [Pyrinomonadaceae bacterium]